MVSAGSITIDASSPGPTLDAATITVAVEVLETRPTFCAEKCGMGRGRRRARRGQLQRASYSGTRFEQHHFKRLQNLQSLPPKESHVDGKNAKKGK